MNKIETRMWWNMERTEQILKKSLNCDWAWSILAALTLVSGVIGNIILN